MRDEENVGDERIGARGKEHRSHEPEAESPNRRASPPAPSKVEINLGEDGRLLLNGSDNKSQRVRRARRVQTYRESLLQRRTHSENDAELGEGPGSAPVVMTDVGEERASERTRRDVGAWIWDSRKGDMRVLLENWMGATALQDKRIWDVCIPGTHNSATYKWTHSEGNKVMLKFVRQFVTCQNKSIYQQLSDGIRFLDIRILQTRSQPMVPLTAHGGYHTAPLLEVYRDIGRFLDEHATEIVFLSIRNDAGSDSKKNRKISLLESDFWIGLYLGRFLGPRLKKDTTVSELINRGQQIVYFHNHIERYIPEGSTEAATSKLFSRLSFPNFTARDSLVEAPTIPRRVRLKEERSSPRQPADNDTQRVNFPLQITFTSSVGPSPRASTPTPPPLTPSALPQTTTRVAATAPATPIPIPSPDKLLHAASENRLEVPHFSHKTALYQQRYHAAEKKFLCECLLECLHNLRGLSSEERLRIEETLQRLSADGQIREASLEIKWSEGLVQYASARAVRKTQHLSEDMCVNSLLSLSKLSDRYKGIEECSIVPYHPIDMQRYKTIGLGKEYMVHPLQAELIPDFAFASPFKTGRTYIEKSWAQTWDSNPNFLVGKLKYWTAMHGSVPPRPPYRLRILAAEVTPPNPAFSDAAGSDTLMFWLGQSAATMLFLPSGLQPNAEAANRMVQKDLLTKNVLSRVNAITHDFANVKIILTIVLSQLNMI